MSGQQEKTPPRKCSRCPAKAEPNRSKCKRCLVLDRDKKRALPKKGTRRCTDCGRAGHTRKTCPGNGGAS